MELVIANVVAVLGKYVIDKGAEFINEGKEAAADAARQLFDAVMDRLKSDPAGARNADGFEKNPEGYSAPVEDALKEEVKADPDFGVQLQALMDQLTAAAPGTIQQIVSGSGAAAAQDSVAAGAGGAAAMGAGATAYVGWTPPPARAPDEPPAPDPNPQAGD
jgi:hypothetical protein